MEAENYFLKIPKMDLNLLAEVAQSMVAEGKGILAIDESHATCTKRFTSIGVECTESTRQQYRQMLITAPVSESVSGMILFDETLRQSTDDGTAFPEYMKANGMIPGIKVDTGAKDLALHPGEKVTEGLDGLRERLAEYAQLGAQFAKWRAVITIGQGMPSRGCIEANAHALARYAALCQEANIVPMVEPEILMDGDHTIEECYMVTSETLQVLFSELKKQRVFLEGLILKVSMVLSGKDCPEQAGVEEVAGATLNCLLNNVPASVAGVVFLSGGQSNKLATEHLNEMNKIATNLPWPLSFSYGRAIQSGALEMWGADQSNIVGAQAELAHRAKMNGLASMGQYTEEAEASA